MFQIVSMSKLLILITTESSEKLAKNLAKLLVKKKLAACVSIKPIYSIYEWEGDIEESKEFEKIEKEDREEGVDT